MSTDEAITYLETEAASADRLAQSLEKWQKNAAVVRERAAKLQRCADVLRKLRATRANGIDAIPGKIS